MTARTQPLARSYDSSGRQARAAEGRRRILAAAHDLFVRPRVRADDHGRHRGCRRVSAPTVYAAGTKAALLKSCVDVALAGEHEPVAILHRPLAQWVYDTDDPREVLSRYAVMMGELGRERHRSTTSWCAPPTPTWGSPNCLPTSSGSGCVHQRSSLRRSPPGVDFPAGRTVAEVRDTVWVCNAPELYVTLTRKRRWSKRRYVDWSRNALLQLVLAPPA